MAAAAAARLTAEGAVGSTSAAGHSITIDGKHDPRCWCFRTFNAPKPLTAAPTGGDNGTNPDEVIWK